jgi:predicted chitinase
MLAPWFRFLIVILWAIAIVFGGVPPGLAQEIPSPIPLTTYNSAPVPAWDELSFASLPNLQAGGQLQVPQTVVNQLGYNPSRSWPPGSALGDVLKLGDVQDAFGLEQFSLGAIAQRSGLNLDSLNLSHFPLLQSQTLSSLVNAIPGLGTLPLNQVKPLADLVRGNLSHLALGSINLDDFGNQPLSAIANTPALGNLSLANLNLNSYTFTQLPGLEQTPLSRFQNWQTASINEIPGLSQVSFADFPISPAGFLGFVALHDVTYGAKEHRQISTHHSITGSDRVGFHYPCNQSKGCAYLELNSPLSLGTAGDPTGLHGAQWIKGGTSAGGQMVPGGYGILGQINGGKEPTGRLPYGPAFKVVLTDTNESQGTGSFGLFFRVCHHGVIDLGCTPYFIGPVPWLPSHEKGLIFVGETQGTPPPGIQAPDTPQAVQDLINQYDPPGSGNGSGYDGDCASQLASAAPSGDRAYATQAIPALLKAAQQYGVSDPGQVAYILATTQAEVDFNSRNEDDTYSRSGACGDYCGRGFVQLTHATNYQKAGQALGIDLIHNPNLANRPDVAAKIAVLGMKNGWFTNRSLGNFINGSTQDFTSARTIINDSDRSQEIAADAQRYYRVLKQCNLSSGGAVTTKTYSGQLISQANGNAVEQKIVQAINQHYGESTASGPANGNEACAWEVNRILQDSVGHTIGGNPNYEPSIEAALQTGAGTPVSPTQAHAGDIVVFDNAAANKGHIGFCMNDGCTQVVSNSSSHAAFNWVGSRSSYDAYYGVNSATHMYRVNK